MIFFFFVFDEISDEPIKKQEPETDLLVLMHPTESTYEKPR